MDPEIKLQETTVLIPPYGEMRLFAPRDVLVRLEKEWQDLWPALRNRLEALCKDHCAEHLQAPRWAGYAGLLGQDAFMGDRAEVILELELLDSPTWAFFLKGINIVHAQPVF